MTEPENCDKWQNTLTTIERWSTGKCNSILSRNISKPADWPMTKTECTLLDPNFKERFLKGHQVGFNLNLLRSIKEYPALSSKVPIDTPLAYFTLNLKDLKVAIGVDEAGLAFVNTLNIPDPPKHCRQSDRSKTFNVIRTFLKKGRVFSAKRFVRIGIYKPHNLMISRLFFHRCKMFQMSYNSPDFTVGIIIIQFIFHLTQIFCPETWQPRWLPVFVCPAPTGPQPVHLWQ